MATLDVCIRGDGAVGLTLALALARQGLRVGVVGLGQRAASSPSPGTHPGNHPNPDLPALADVRAYALNAASRQLLTDLRVWDALPADAVTAVDDMQVLGDAPPGLLQFSAWQQGCEALAWIVDAAALGAALQTAARFAPHLVLLGDSGTGGAADSSPDAPGATLTVLAEGRDSVTRAALGVVVERLPYGHSALAARLVADAPHAGVARQWFRAPDVLALLPFDRPEPTRSCALVWSMPTARAAALQAAPQAEFEAALADATGAGMGHADGDSHGAGTLRLASARATWPLALAGATPLCGPGWVLVGDAAHQVHPLAGQGLNLGLADAASLARVIAAREPWRTLGDVSLLRRHVRERAAATQAMSWVTDGLLHLFAQPQPLVRELRNRGMGLLNQLAPIKRFLTNRALGA